MVESMPKPRQNVVWRYIAGAVAAAGLLSVLGLAAGFMLFRTNVHIHRVPIAEAHGEFERITARFAGQAPLIDADGRVTYRAAAPSGGSSFDRLHVLAYDPREERLFEITVPEWLLRLAPRGQPSVRIDGDEVLGAMNGRRVSVDELRRHSPGLILDRESAREGGRVLVWTE